MNKEIDKNQIGEGPLNEEQLIYKENILDYYRNPRNKGKLDNATVVHEEHNPLCGDKVTMHLRIVDDKIHEVLFEGEGCAISQASASLLTEKIKDLSVDEVKTITREEILEMVGVPLGPVRTRCALLGLKTVIRGLEK